MHRSRTRPAQTSARNLAQHAARQRLLNAYLRETGNHDPRISPTDATFRLWLPTSGCTLVGTMAHWSPMGLHVYGDHLGVHRSADGSTRKVEHRELVQLVLAELSARESGARVSEEGAGSAMSLRRQEELARQIECSVDRTASYLARPRADPPTTDRPRELTRRAEQSVLFGHPLHPTPKSAEGFSDADTMAYSPELGTTFALHYVAVAPELVTECRVAPGAWLPRQVREVAEHRLRSAQRDHLPIPLHPWQARHLLRDDVVRRLVRTGALVPLGAVGPRVYPTSSVRTVCDPGFPTSWKLPLNVRLTNFVRNNPAEHLRRATDASALIAALGVNSAHSECFEVLLETGSHTLDHPELGPDFSVLYRDNPFADHSRPRRAEAPQVLAGLLDGNPAHGEPELVRAVRLAVGAGSGPLPFEAVAAWLRRYLEISLLPLLDVFARYGVSLEAHVQNSLVHLENGWPARFFVRDMEGTSVSRQRITDLRHQDSAVLPLAEDSAVLYDDAEAWRRFQYYVITNHLGHLLHVLGRFGNLDECLLWTVVADTLRAAVPTPYAAELLTAPTLPAKANLISRFAERGERPLYVAVPNPIRKDHR